MPMYFEIMLHMIKYTLLLSINKIFSNMYLKKINKQIQERNSVNYECGMFSLECGAFKLHQLMYS